MTREPLDPLSDALRSLPRERASRGFKDAVLRRLDESPARRAGHWLRPLLAAAALATLVAGLWLGSSPEADVGDQQSARLEALESERQRLESELAEIRDLMSRGRPREIYLGGNEQVDVFFDVGWSAVRRADSLSHRSGITPAGYPMNQSDGL